MSEQKNNSRKWWKRWEVWGTALQGLGALLMLFPNTTTAYSVGGGISIALGTITQVKGLIKGYQADNLPGGITKVLDIVPNSITGIKGSSSK